MMDPAKHDPTAGGTPRGDTGPGSVADLERQLAEARREIAAIRSGSGAAPAAEPGSAEPAAVDRFYRRMVEQLGEGAVAVDVDGSIRYGNARFAALIGQPLGELLGRAFTSLVVPPEQADCAALLACSGARGADFLLHAADGSVVPVKVSASTLEEPGDDRVHCLIVTDLRLEPDRDRLRAEHRRKEEFLAVLAHELRNPLAPIASAVHVVRHALRESEADAARTAVEVVDRQVSHMTHLIDDLLDVARIARGAIQLRKTALDVRRVVRTVVESLAPQLAERGQELAVEIDPDPLVVHGDTVRLTQVVENLLSNASKYTPDGGAVEVVVRRDADSALIRVRDSGIGIRVDQLDSVFDMFWQADTTYGRSATGLGIGLSLVRRLVEQHGGAVSAQSEGPDTGSTFSVRLPLARGTPDGTAAPGHASRPAPKPSPGPVLVVDDNHDAATMLAMLLRVDGREVHVAHSGAEALEVEREVQPAVVVLDIGMPGMDGLEVARRLRARRPGGELVLIALSGHGRREDRERAAQAGFDHYFVKPVAFEDLRHVLAQR